MSVVHLLVAKASGSFPPKDTVMGRASKLVEEWLSPGHDGTGFQVWCQEPRS